MIKNEFINLTDFTSQYTGEWNPAEGHWFGLDFTYKYITYRLLNSTSIDNTCFRDIIINKDVELLGQD